MIAKCIAILAVVAQISASPCGCPSSVLLTTCESNPCSSPCSAGSVVIQSSSSSSPSSGSSVITKNIVADSKYPVALKNCGPTPDQEVSVTTSHVTAPVQEKPTVRLPSNIPAPKTISHTCTCYKTILRPRVHQQVITVPIVQRYLETIHKPVLENLRYEAVPVNCLSGGSFASGTSAFQLVGCSSSSDSVSNPLEVPCVQVVEAPKCQTVEIPLCQSVEVPKCQTVEVPRVQVIEAPKCQAIEIPRCQIVEAPKCQSVEIPRIQIVEAPKACFSFKSSCSPCQC